MYAIPSKIMSDRHDRNANVSASKNKIDIVSVSKKQLQNISNYYMLDM